MLFDVTWGSCPCGPEDCETSGKFSYSVFNSSSLIPICSGSTSGDYFDCGQQSVSDTYTIEAVSADGCYSATITGFTFYIPCQGFYPIELDWNGTCTCPGDKKNGGHETFKLLQNYPNPFNPTTKISYSVPKTEDVKLVVYDITGREVVTLVNEYVNAGVYSVDFDGSNLASGVYIYKIQAGSFTDVKKMLLIK